MPDSSCGENASANFSEDAMKDLIDKQFNRGRTQSVLMSVVLLIIQYL